MGMQNGAAVVENSLAHPQKAKHRIAVGPISSTPSYIRKRIENRDSDTCMPVFIVA